MKRVYFTSFIFLSLLFSCDTSDDSITDAITKYTYTTNSQIVTEEIDDLTFAKIEEGDNLVFKYLFTRSQDDDISDDEYSEVIIFQIDANAEEFDFTNDELASVFTYFDQYCFCPYYGSIQIIDGNISGVKVDSQNWDITIDVTFSINDDILTKQVSGVFTQE